MTLNTPENFENGDETKINYYHAHVYYGKDATARETAARLREKVWNKWHKKVRMGRFRDQAVDHIQFLCIESNSTARYLMRLSHG